MSIYRPLIGLIVVIISSFAVADSEAAVGFSNPTQYAAGLISESPREFVNSVTTDVLGQKLEEANVASGTTPDLNSGLSEETYFMILDRNEIGQLKHINMARDNGGADNGDEDEEEDEEKEGESEGFDRLWDVSNLA